MLRTMRALLLTVVAIGFAAGNSWAQNPQFKSTSSTLACPYLEASFRLVGLGNVGTAQVTLQGTCTATYACYNKGGKNPEAANKTTVTAPVSQFGSFPVRNGQTSGSLELSPPDAGGFTCPGGQRLVLEAVSYSDVTLIYGNLTVSVSGGSCP